VCKKKINFKELGSTRGFLRYDFEWYFVLNPKIYKIMDITVEELRNRLEAGEELNLIDVREEHEFESDNLGAYLIPLGELPERIAELEGLKDKEVLIHCRSGARSEKAKQYLISQGFQNVRNVLGGILAYRELEQEEE